MRTEPNEYLDKLEEIELTLKTYKEVRDALWAKGSVADSAMQNYIDDVEWLLKNYKKENNNDK